MRAASMLNPSLSLTLAMNRRLKNRRLNSLQHSDIAQHFHYALDFIQALVKSTPISCKAKDIGLQNTAEYGLQQETQF